MAAIDGAWAEALEPEFHKEYYKKLYGFVKQEYATQVIYPPSDKLFTALHLTPLDRVSIPSHTVTNISSSFLSQRLSLTSLSISEGFPPSMARFFIMVIALTMKRAAGTPFPETSPSTMQR